MGNQVHRCQLNSIGIIRSPCSNRGMVRIEHEVKGPTGQCICLLESEVWVGIKGRIWKPDISARNTSKSHSGHVFVGSWEFKMNPGVILFVVAPLIIVTCGDRENVVSRHRQKRRTSVERFLTFSASINIYLQPGRDTSEMSPIQ